ncbi:hypothetical protein ACIPSE_01890 [Streptomyces sp. NPDC090106]|uniref:hypothetical protein n=1 Tax=Streptomyces sp. NPDC090106 TaxID=3365946 RepID=UPI0037F34F7C
MSAGPDRGPDRGPHSRPDRGFDALMAALTDAPLPEDADAALRAEHRAATADLALLREQLGVIGDALAGPSPGAAAPARVVPARVGPSRLRRWAPRIAVGSLVAAGAAVVVTGMGWLIATNGADITGDSDSGASKAEADAPAADAARFGSPHYLACTRLVAEGTVVSVERLADGVQLRVTVEVSRYYKQDTGDRPDRLTYVVDDTFTDGLGRGDQVLFGVPRGAVVPDHWVVGEREVARERAWVQASLPQSRDLGC